MSAIRLSDDLQRLRPGPGRYVADGPGREWMRWCHGEGKPPRDELLWEGPAGPGKSRCAWEGLLDLADQHSDLRVAVVRKTRVSMTQSVLALLENQVLGPTHPVIAAKGQRKTWTDLRWPSGAEFAFIGMEEPSRLYSTEWHIIWWNEAEEAELRQWESLHRGLRAPGGPGWRLLLGDYNPPHASRWICSRGESSRLKGVPPPALTRFWKHHHNPIYYDKTRGAWTEAGIEYLGKLRRTMSGPRLQSLLYGKRTTSAGMIWATYDPGKHRITGKLEKRGGAWYLHVKEWEKDKNLGGMQQVPGHGDSPVRLDWFLGALDFGFRAPGCLQVWGFDSAHRMFRVAEVYQTERDIDWWADWAERLWSVYGYKVGVCDHAPDSISILNKRVGPRLGRKGRAVWRPWDKTKTAGAEKAGIDQMRVRWKQDAAFLVRDAYPAGFDTVLQEAGRPVCFEDEIGQYVYPEEEEGKVLGERIRESPAVGVQGHACDAARGSAAYVFLKDLTPLDMRGPDRRSAPGTFAAEFGHESVFRKDRRFVMGLEEEEEYDDGNGGW